MAKKINRPKKVKEVRPKINQALLGRINSLKHQKPAINPALNPYALANIARPPPGVVPEGAKLAMDDIINSSLNWAAQSLIQGVWAEGLMFMGYPYLSELAQRSEYRHIVETISTEMTREWINITSKSENADKSNEISEINDELTRMGVKDAFRRVAEKDGFFGRCHLFLDLGDKTDNDTELKTPIGTGDETDDISKVKIKKDSFRAVKVVEPMWTYPAYYNASNPLADDWYEPQTWYVMGREIHRTRLLTFIGRELPDMLKPAYSFGGLSLSQMAKPYVDNWLRTRQSVADIVHSFVVFILQTNMATLMEGGTADGDILSRLDVFNALRDNKGVMALDKDTEDFKNVSAPLGGLHELQAQAQEQMCSVSKIPLIKFTGISPSGLNATADGELQCFYSWINAYQEKLFRAPLTTVINFIQLSKFGRVDPDIVFNFKGLWGLDDKQEADTRKLEAETDTIYVTAGVIDRSEVRTRLAKEEDGLYKGLDIDILPDDPAESAMQMEHDLNAQNPDGGNEKDPTAVKDAA